VVVQVNCLIIFTQNESFCAGANKLDENLCKDVNTSPATGL